MRRWLVAVLALAAFGAGCSSSKSTAVPPAPSASSTAPTGSTSPSKVAGIDACKLLNDSEVAAATGATASGREQYPQQPTAKLDTPIQVGCTWGELGGDNGVIGIQISDPNGLPIDPLKTVIGTLGTGTAVDVAPGAMLYTKALIPFGGGEGHTIVWTHNGKTVAVGLVRGDAAKVEAAARAVNGRLS